jgi:hypothetical protein
MGSSKRDEAWAGAKIEGRVSVEEPGNQTADRKGSEQKGSTIRITGLDRVFVAPRN